MSKKFYNKYFYLNYDIVIKKTKRYNCYNKIKNENYVRNVFFDVFYLNIDDIKSYDYFESIKKNEKILSIVIIFSIV